jgi:hypothetical protein
MTQQGHPVSEKFCRFARSISPVKSFVGEFSKQEKTDAYYIQRDGSSIRRR